MEQIITDPACPHQRVRLKFSMRPGRFKDANGPLVVRLDDKGNTSVVAGFHGNFNTNPIAYAWKRYKNVNKVARYLGIYYGAVTEFVGDPNERSFAWAVIAHPDWIATFGGEGDQAPDKQWISQSMAVALKEVDAHVNGWSWAFVGERLVTGVRTLVFDEPGREDETAEFERWEETGYFDGYLDEDWAEDEAQRYLAGEVYECKRRYGHGA